MIWCTRESGCGQENGTSTSHRGGTGRRYGLKIRWPARAVRVRSPPVVVPTSDTLAKKARRRGISGRGRSPQGFEPRHAPPLAAPEEPIQDLLQILRVPRLFHVPLFDQQAQSLLKSCLVEILGHG